MDTVVDLTESPETPAFPPPATSLPGQTADGPVVVLSDDEDSGNGFSSSIRLPGITNLPTGLILPPLRSQAESEQSRPERITTLREVLMPSRRHRSLRHSSSTGGIASSSTRLFPPRSVASRNVPAAMMQAPIISDVLQHTGDEPVVPGVYNPIHSRPLLPHERQHHVQRVARPDASSALLPSSVAGRETADGSIDVEDVDPTPYAEAATRVEQMRQRSDRASRMRHAFGQRLMDTAARGGMGRYGDDNDDYDIDEDDYDRGYGFNGDGGGEQGGSGSASTDEYGRLLPLAFPPHAHVVIPRTGESAVDLFFRDLNSRPEAARWRAGGAARTSQRQSSRGQRTRDGSRRRSGSQRPVFPFHPGLIPHHFRRGASGRISPFDFFHSEDIGDLLAFIDANAPAPPPQPPQPPLPALRLTKQQQELAKKDDYTRTVPDANYRDAPRDAAALSSPEAMEIVCTLCEGTLYEKEPAWASSCGHVICNACYGDFSGASKLCSACSKRMVKSRMVHLFS